MQAIGLYSKANNVTLGVLRPIFKALLKLFGLYVLTDYGVTAGVSISSGARTTNTTSLTSLVALVAANSGGWILVPPGVFEFNAVQHTHTSGAPRSVSFQGAAGYQSTFTFFGTTGNLWDWVGDTTNTWNRFHIRDLILTCGNAMVSGTYLRFPSGVSDVYLENIWIKSGGAVSGAWTAIQLGASNITGALVPGGLHMTRVKTGLVSGSTGSALHVYSAVGVYAYACDFSGYTDVATAAASVRFSPNGNSTVGATYSIFDTAIFTSCLFKDALYGLKLGEAGGNPGFAANIQVVGGHFDGIGVGAAFGWAIYIVTAANCSVGSVEIINPWIEVYGTASYGVYLDKTTGTAINRISVVGGKISRCTQQALKTIGAVEQIVFESIRIEDESPNLVNSVEITGGNIITIVGNQVGRTGGGTTTGRAGVISGGGAVTNALVVANSAQGKTTSGWFDASGGAAGVFANNTP